MKLDSRLNLVIPIEQGNGVIYAHNMPVSAETFDQHYLTIAKTFSAIHSEGLGAIAGPRVAAKLLKNIAVRDETWEGPLGVEAGVMNEIRRLTNVVIPSGVAAVLDEKTSENDPDVWRAPAWSTITLHEALQKGMIDNADKEVVENALVFFTVVSSMHTKEALRGLLISVCGLWNAQTSSFNSTEFAASLPTSIVIASSGETAPVSVHPS